MRTTNTMQGMVNILLKVSMLVTIVAVLSCNHAEEKKPVDAAVASTAKDSVTVMPAAAPANFKHAQANVNGVNIHYVIGGQGEPLLLVHGFGQNWFMWNRVLPELSKHFTVIAPDLRGVGESEKTAGGYDKKTMATDLHELMKKLGFTSIKLAGHDIGLMVAYAYAAQYGKEVKKLALMDALLPGIEPVWSDFSGRAWWFGFFARPVAGDLVAGQAGEFLQDFWPVVGHVKDPFTKEETAEFIRAYSVPGATTGSFHWFGEFAHDAEDNKLFSKQKLQMPVLSVGAAYGSGSFLAAHCRVVANDVKEVKLAGVGHWILQEATDSVQQHLLEFFTDK